MSASVSSWLRYVELLSSGFSYIIAGVLVGYLTGEKQPSALVLLSERFGALIFSGPCRFGLQFLPVEIICVRVGNLIDLRPIACPLKRILYLIKH
jgi:hypothetical protein